jgi:hypothetical protein
MVPVFLDSSFVDVQAFDMFGIDILSVNTKRHVQSAF